MEAKNKELKLRCYYYTFHPTVLLIFKETISL
ncbi:hypothetical protein HPDP_00296 [Candidatus Hepatincola sp. Pdp]